MGMMYSFNIIILDLIFIADGKEDQENWERYKELEGTMGGSQ